LLLAPQEFLAAEEEAISRGERPTTVLEIGLWAKEYEPIDVFNWQHEISNMISLSDLERELVVAGGRVRAAVDRGLVKPDHVLQLGERTYIYFNRERIEEIRVAIGAPKIDAHNVRDRFLEFIEAMDMSMSYKPVLLLALLEVIDDSSRAKISDVARSFQRFYHERRAAGLIVEREGARKIPVDELDTTSAQRLMLGMPFEKFERQRFLQYDRDLAYIRFAPDLWRQLGLKDLEKVREICRTSIDRYYSRITSASS
jgi:hypothetical protein